jgi:hypothetical protein
MVKARNKRAERQEKQKGASKKRDKNVTLISFKEKDILQRWLITSEGCPTCEELKHNLRKEIKKGIVKLTDVGDEKGFEIISELGIDAVPIFITELRDGFPVRYIIDE